MTFPLESRRKKWRGKHQLAEVALMSGSGATKTDTVIITRVVAGGCVWGCFSVGLGFFFPSKGSKKTWDLQSPDVLLSKVPDAFATNIPGLPSAKTFSSEEKCCVALWLPLKGVLLEDFTPLWE